MKRLLVGGALVAATLGGIGAPAAAQQYPPQPPSVTLNVSITVINFGGNVNLTFIGCLIGESVAIGFNGVSSITSCFSAGGGASRHLALAGGGGMAVASVTAPREAGQYTVTMTGLSSGFSASRTVTVTGPKAEAAETATPAAPQGGSSGSKATAEAGSKAASSGSARASTSAKSSNTSSASKSAGAAPQAAAPAAPAPAAAPAAGAAAPAAVPAAPAVPAAAPAAPADVAVATPQAVPAQLAAASEDSTSWATDPRLWIVGSTVIAGAGLSAVAFGRRRRATISN